MLRKERSSMTRRTASLLMLIVSACLCVIVGNAQTAATATIVGTVLDPQGAVVANATVVAKKVDTGLERTTKSTSEGLYRFDNLQPGIYEVRVDAQGFAKAEAKGVKLQVGEQRDLNFDLGVTGATVTIDVSAGGELV